MKTKNLYVLAVGFFSVLFIIFIIVVPFLMFIQHIWTAIAIVLAFVIVGLVIYMINVPGYKMHKFHDHDVVVKIKKLQGLRYTYCKAKYEFSCGQAVIQMQLEQYGIHVTQDEILEISGDKSLGTTPWEMEEIFNKIFSKKKLPLRARIHYYTKYSQLFDQVHKDRGVIVMFINQFHEDGYSSKASYPHFALLNYINMSSITEKNKVVLTNPSYSDETNPHFKPGKYKGEIEIPCQDFQERFYISQKHLNRLRYKPTRGMLPWYKKWWNRGLNFLFIFAMYVGYCTKILKPGLAIFIEPVEKK